MPALVLSAAGYVAASLAPGWRSWLAMAAVLAIAAIWTASAVASSGAYGMSMLLLSAALLPFWVGLAGGLLTRAISLSVKGVGTSQRVLISVVGLIPVAAGAWWIFQNL